jgi:retron-type reverse transcriptase
VATAGAMLVEAIDEQDCCAFASGFRPGRSPQQALPEVRQGLLGHGSGEVIDGDSSAVVDHVPHDTLGTMLRQRSKDGRVRELLERWRHAGILDGKAMVCPDTGRPPGSVRSPL